MKIVHIDDSNFELAIFSRYIHKLRKWEIEYVPFVSEEEGMGNILTRTYDLIFLDYYLATSIAPDIISSIRAGGCDTPIIVLSAKEYKKDMIDKIQKAGGNKFYHKKNFDENTIDYIIHKYLDASVFLPMEAEKAKELSQLSILYKDGRLIQNYVADSGKLVAEDTGNARSHLFASSLIAVDQFLQEAAESASPFQQIQSNDMTLMMERGNWIAVSAITKTPNPYIRSHIHDMIVEIEIKFEDILEHWTGNLRGLNFDPFIDELHPYAE